MTKGERGMDEEQLRNDVVEKSNNDGFMPSCHLVHKYEDGILNHK